jgi:hypothetical protein
MMHCTMEDLVALRDGEGSVYARRHVEECPACLAELDALYQRVAQLKALPVRRPPRDRWAAIRAEAAAGRRHGGRAIGFLGLLAAATIAGLIVFRPWADSLHAELTQAKQQSATLESTLQQVGGDDRVMSGREAALAAALEDRIAVIDALLEDPSPSTRSRDAQLVQLWQQRVRLMQQLLDVRATRATYVGL